MTIPFLHMQRITKDFPGARALDNVSFSVAGAKEGRGEIHALCGENGAGKSTLIKILGGVHPYGTYEGNLLINGETQKFRTVRDAVNAGIAIIHQELALIPEMTVAENIYLGIEPRRFGIINRNALYHDAAQLLSQFGLNIPVHAHAHELGIGQQQLVEIAKALSRSSRLLVLDEPTAALTESEVTLLHQSLAKLQAKRVACIYITHKLKEIFEIADRVTVLRDGKTVSTQTIQDCTEARLISQMVGRKLTTRFPHRNRKKTHTRPDNEIRMPQAAKEQAVLQVENLSTYPVEPPRLDSITFEVQRGEILGLAGLMGAGRTELIHAIFGASAIKSDGRVLINGNVVAFDTPRDAIAHGIGLVSEDRRRYGLILDAGVDWNMTLPALAVSTEMVQYGVINSDVTYQKSNRYVESLRIKTGLLKTPVSHLSGGNQQKVVLGKWLMTRPILLLLDEPTRGIDVGAKAEIYAIIAQLAEDGVAIVLVSSELPEILGMSDRILVLHDGKITGEFINKNVTQEDILRYAAGIHEGNSLTIPRL